MITTLPFIILLGGITIESVHANTERKCTAQAQHHAFEVEVGDVFKIRCSDLRNMAFDSYEVESVDGRRLRDAFCDETFTDAITKCGGVCEGHCDKTCVDEPKKCFNLSPKEACKEKECVVSTKRFHLTMVKT